MPACVCMCAFAACSVGAVDPCRTAFEDRDWPLVANACRDWIHRDEVRVGAAWEKAARPPAAQWREFATTVESTRLAFDGLAIAGYAAGRSELPEEQARAPALLASAAFGHAGLGRHAASAYDAATLSRLPRTTMRLGDARRWAAWSLAEAMRSGNARAQGMAHIAIAEIEDDLGLTDDARDDFFHGAETLTPWPDKLAFAYLKHGLFLLDLGDEAGLRGALYYLDAADEAAERGFPAGDPSRHTVHFAAQLNRADALAQQGDLAAAERALTLAPQRDAEASKLSLVRGYIAARRGDLAAAEARFAEAAVDDIDYRARVAYEIATLQHRAGHAREAEQSYRQAIAAVEELRRDAGGVEVRPSILARWSRSYVGLLQLMVEQERGADALVVAESLHARSWLDSVRAGTRRGTRTLVDALHDVRVQEAAADAPLDRDGLLALIGDREALIVTAVDEGTWRIHARRGQVVAARLTAADIEAVEAFRRDPADAAVAARAGAALIPADLEHSDEPLHIVASGSLAALSFPALRRGDHFLVDDRPIARLPGLATLACRPRVWNGRRVFIGDAQRNLPLAADEVRQLGGATALLGSDANRAAVLAAAHASLLHVAVHGTVTIAGGALQLADGPLTAADILEGDVGPEVVVLTGCATAASRDAEDWGSFPSSFVAAGSRRVIATLRAVDDGEAALFATRYYAADAGVDPIERLAVVQRAFAATGELPVAAWSSFAVWGAATCAVDPR